MEKKLYHILLNAKIRKDKLTTEDGQCEQWLTSYEEVRDRGEKQITALWWLVARTAMSNVNGRTWARLSRAVSSVYRVFQKM